MAQLINSALGKIINITSEAAHQAEYKPVTDDNGNPVAKPSHCDIPPLLDISLNLNLPTITEIKTCDLNFIPFPIIPPLFIPDDLTTPCPDGMTVEMKYTPSVAQTVGITTATPAVVTGTSVHFNDIIGTAAGLPLPSIAVDFPQTASNSATFEIVHGERYQVLATGSDLVDDDHILYEGVQYHVGETFYGKTNTSAAIGKVNGGSVKVGLNQIQTRRITGVNESTVDVATPFTVTQNLTGLNWALNRFVVQVDDTQPIAANLQFRKVDVLGCEYQLLGELNLNTPCPDGFAFDSQYNSTSTEYLTSNGTGTITTATGNTITNFNTLIPHAVGQPLPIFELHGATATTLVAGLQYKAVGGTVIADGNTYAEGQYIKLAVGGSVTGGTGVVRRAYQNYVTAVTDTTLTVAPQPDGAVPDNLAGLLNSKSNSWLLNRLVVKNAAGPSTFLYVKDTDDSCSGKLLAEINLPAAEAPCKDGTTFSVIGAETFKYGYTDYNNYNTFAEDKDATITLPATDDNQGVFTGSYATLGANLNNLPGADWSSEITPASLNFQGTNEAAPECKSKLTLPNVSIYPQIPVIIPGEGIQIKKGFKNNVPIIQVTNTGTGGSSTNTTTCEGCCYWA